MRFYDNIFAKKKSIAQNPDKAITEVKEDASMLANKGNTLVENGMYEEALKCYDRTLEINPTLADVWNNKGLALARSGKHREAIQCYDTALKLKPDDLEVIYNKGIALSQIGASGEAVVCFDRLFELNPADAAVLCSKGDVLFESGKFEEALHAYDRSIAIDPKDETVWNNRGLTLVKLNRLPEAIESYDKALEINPAVEKIWSNKGLALKRMKQTEETIDLHKFATTIPVEGNVIPLTEILPQKSKDTEITTASQVPGSFIKTIIQEPIFIEDSEGIELIESEPVRRSIIKVGIPKQTPRETEKKEEIVQDIHGEATEYIVMGNTIYSMGKYEEAIDSFNKALQIYPENSIAWNNKGLAFAKMGDLDEAIGCYENALMINPEDPVFLTNKGSTMYKKGDIEEAIGCFESALELNPESKTAKKGLELCYGVLENAVKNKKKFQTKTQE